MVKDEVNVCVGWNLSSCGMPDLTVGRRHDIPNPAIPLRHGRLCLDLGYLASQCSFYVVVFPFACA